MNMEPLNQKSLERVVSQKALQIGSSFPCQICVVGFLSGVCLTSLFLALLTSLGTFEFGGISFSAISQGNSPLNSSSSGFINTVANVDCKFKRNEVVAERWVNSKRSKDGTDDERVLLLHSAWSALLSESVDGKSAFWHRAGLDKSAVPNAPHLENCKLSGQTNERLDMRAENERLPPWTTWKGLLDTHPAFMANEQLEYLRHQAISEGAYPPWIIGSDEENYPLTRKVQRDIWLHQHPENCRDPNVRLLVADWERLPGFGIGAQLAGMCGLLAIAINEKRVLVTSYYNRADHDGCKGSYNSSWSCYFFPETSQECRDRAFELLGNKEALERGIITTKDSYKSKEIWTGRTPRAWGEPWRFLQPTTEINGSLVAFHRKMDRRWWRAQAIRYLMRFQTQYMCGLMNIARNAAFGKEAAASPSFSTTQKDAFSTQNDSTRKTQQPLQVAKRLEKFKTTIFTQMSSLAIKYGAINLGQGFPNFDGPEFVKEAAIQSIKDGKNQYARGYGVPDFNSAIAERFKKDTGLVVDPDKEITVTSGCTEAIAATILGLINPGDEVILFAPFYDSYEATLSMAGAKIKGITLRPPAFSVPIDELKSAITKNTRAILINTPHNPTGKMFTREELSTIASLCIENDVLVFTDEVYDKLAFETDHISTASLPGMYERTVTLNSLGKTFSLTGWKIGWAIAPPHLTWGVRQAHSFLTFATSTPMQSAAAVALRAPESYYVELKRDYMAKKEILVEGLKAVGFKVFPSSGTYFVVVDHTPFGLENDIAFCEYLIKEVGVVAIPTSVFYLNPEDGKNLVRFTFCKDEETLKAAVERMKEKLKRK